MDEAPLPHPGPPATARVHGGPPNRVVRNLVVGALIVMVLAGNLANAFLSKLLTEHPLVFIGLSSSNRNLALASGDLAAWSFYVVAFLRLLAPDPLFFLLGRWYGDGAIRWMEQRSPTYGQLLRQLEAWFEKARYVVVAIFPNNPVCLLAGASSMTWPAFLVANVVGTAVRLVLVRAFADVFENPLGDIRGFIGDYRNPLLVLSIGLVAMSIWSERRAGRDRIGDLVNLEEEIAEAERADGATGDPATAPAAGERPGTGHPGSAPPRPAPAVED